MVVARCWQQWITGEGKRCTVAEGSDVPEHNDREDRAIKKRANTSAPTTTSLASIQRHLPPSIHSAIKRKPYETTDRSWLEEPTSAKTPPLTPHHVDDGLPTSGTSECDRLGDVIFSDESRSQSQC
ncbi:hypothetical protein TNCV_148191 [Trichonephila clavipes]|nr:hypothetical protein TNCV_148191 [Trichonephila clavipes]